MWQESEESNAKKKSKNYFDPATFGGALRSGQVTTKKESEESNAFGAKEEIEESF